MQDGSKLGSEQRLDCLGEWGCGRCRGPLRGRYHALHGDQEIRGMDIDSLRIDDEFLLGRVYLRICPLDGIEGGLGTESAQVGAAISIAVLRQRALELVQETPVLGMDVDAGPPSFEIRQGDEELAVAAAGTSKRRGEVVGAFGRTDDYDLAAAVQAVQQSYQSRYDVRLDLF